MSVINQIQIIVTNDIIYNSEVLKYNLCDYNDDFTLIKDIITILGHNVTQMVSLNVSQKLIDLKT